MKKKKQILSSVTVILLLVGLTGMGKTYALWTGFLKFDTQLTTGVMDLVFSEGQSFSMILIDDEGKELERIEELSVSLQPDGKTAEISAEFPLAVTYLLEENHNMIKLECYLDQGKSGTINEIEHLTPNWSEDVTEKVEWIPSSMMLVTGGGEYDLPDKLKASFGTPLSFYVYGGTEEKNGHAVAAIYLALDDKSCEKLLKLPEQIELNEEDFPDGSELYEDGVLEVWDMENEEILEEEETELGKGSEQYWILDADIVVAYECSLPLYIEQGHEEMIRLTEGEERNE